MIFFVIHFELVVGRVNASIQRYLVRLHIGNFIYCEIDPSLCVEHQVANFSKMLTHVQARETLKRRSPSKTTLTQGLSPINTNSNHGISDTSISIFRSFLQKSPKNGTIQSALGVISKECYELWLKTRKFPSKSPEKAFQRALSGHVCGVDGRVPFTQEEEVEILKVLRRKKRWECFIQSKVKFGESGFRSKGFHEKLKLGEIQLTHPKKRSKKIIKKIHDMELEGEEAEDDEPESDDSGSETSIGANNTTRRHSDATLNTSRQQRTRVMNADELRQPSKKIRVDDESEGQVTTATNTSSSSSSSSACSSEIEEDEDEEDEDDLSAEKKVQLASSFGFQLPILRTLDGVRTSTLENTLKLVGIAPLIVTQVAQLIMRLDARKIPWVEGLYNASRSMLAGRGDCRREARDRQPLLDLLATMSERFPGQSVLIIDVSCPSYRDRIAEQNEFSQKLFGKISKRDGGNDAQRFNAVDILKVLRGFMRSYIFGEVSSFQARYKCAPNGELKLCEITHIWNKEHGVFIECAKPLE